MRLAQCLQLSPGKVLTLEVRCPLARLEAALLLAPLLSSGLSLVVALDGWAVGINSSTFTLRSLEVNSFSARAARLQLATVSKARTTPLLGAWSSGRHSVIPPAYEPVPHSPWGLARFPVPPGPSVHR